MKLWFSIHWTSSNEGQESWEMETNVESPETASVYSLERSWRPEHWSGVWRTPWVEEMRWSQERGRRLVFMRQSIREESHTQRGLWRSSVPACLWWSFPSPRQEPSGRVRGKECPHSHWARWMPAPSTGLQKRVTHRALSRALRKGSECGSYLGQAGEPITPGTK